MDETRVKRTAKLLKDAKTRQDLEKRIVKTGGVWMTAQDVKKNILKMKKTKGARTMAL